jgi:predicted lipoprotein with Yx(FWY)xxD motif
VPARGRPLAGGGARARLVGTTARRDGTRQLTYAGHPVYLYVGDSPGRVLCHDVTEYGGVWRVVRADGRAVH